MLDGNELGGGSALNSRPNGDPPVTSNKSSGPGRFSASPEEGTTPGSFFDPRTPSRQSHNPRSLPVKKTALLVVRTDIPDARLYLGPAQ